MARVCTGENCQNLRLGNNYKILQMFVLGMENASLQLNERESDLMEQNKLLRERINTLEETNKMLEKKLENFMMEKTLLSPLMTKIENEKENKDHVAGISTKLVKKEKAEDLVIPIKKHDIDDIDIKEQEYTENTVEKEKSPKEELHNTEVHEYFEEGIASFRKEDQFNRNWIKMESNLVFCHDIKTTVTEPSAATTTKPEEVSRNLASEIASSLDNLSSGSAVNIYSSDVNGSFETLHKNFVSSTSLSTSSFNLRKKGRKTAKRTSMDNRMRSSKNKFILDKTSIVNDVLEGKVLINQSVKPECYFRISGNRAQLTALEKKLENIDTKKFHCDICSRKFPSKYAVKNHKLIHTVGDKIGDQVGPGLVRRIQNLVKRETRAYGAK